ncbi:MAG: hypothetical protein U0319_08860 [Nitrospira sp.]
MTTPQTVLFPHRRSGLAPQAAVAVACLLIAIRVVAGFLCHTCFIDFEKPTSRSFHLHAGGDHEPCHHGQAEASPLITWACTVTQDETAFILPEIPRLPLLVSLFVSLSFWLSPSAAVLWWSLMAAVLLPSPTKFVTSTYRFK